MLLDTWAVPREGRTLHHRKPGDRRSQQPRVASIAAFLSTPAREGAEENMILQALRRILLPVFLLAAVCNAQTPDNSPDAHLTGTLLDSSGGGKIGRASCRERV